MDLQMPVMDGYEATKRIRTHEKFGDIPIIGLSASILESDRNRALEAKMNDYIAKPFHANELYLKTVKVLELSIDDIENTITPQELDTPEQKEWERYSEIPEIIKGFVDEGDVDGLKDFVRSISANFTELVQVLKKTSHDSDKKELRLVNHKLKTTFHILNLGHIQASIKIYSKTRCHP